MQLGQIDLRDVVETEFYLQLGQTHLLCVFRFVLALGHGYTIYVIRFVVLRAHCLGDSRNGEKVRCMERYYWSWTMKSKVATVLA